MEAKNIKIPWPGWQIVRSLGRGNYGVVYEIERDVFGRKEKAALKVISIPKDQSEVESDYTEGYDEKSINEKYSFYLEKIVKEYQLMVEMKGHSNIVNCDDFAYILHEGEIGWDVFIRMELLKPLKTVLREGDLSEQQIVKLGVDICRALVFCEQKNIIHRDIKPENIMVSAFGDFKLGDFGVARTMDHTTHATRTGTDRYMAPEVIKSEKYGQDADIYSLGIVLYWLLNSRRLPFLPTNRIPTEPEVNEAQSKRVRGERIPAPANGSTALKQIVLKACSYKREDRYKSAREMLDELEKLEAGATDSGRSKRDAGQSAGTGQTNSGGTCAGGESSSEKTVGNKTMGATGNGWNGSQGTVGNNWNDTRGTIGAPGGYKKQQEAQYEKTMGADWGGAQKGKTQPGKTRQASSAENNVKSLTVEDAWKQLRIMEVVASILFVGFAVYSDMYDPVKKVFAGKFDPWSILFLGIYIAAVYFLLKAVLVGKGKILGFLVGFFQGIMLSILCIECGSGDIMEGIGAVGGIVWTAYHFWKIYQISNATRGRK